MTSDTKLKRILIVDDDPTIIKMLDVRLTENGYSVITAIEAAEGLQTAIDVHPDLIILDVMMPIINGYNFCKLLKSEEGKKHIPVIFLTARDTEEDIKIGQEMGAEAYLTKPVNIKELLDTIEKFLN